MIEINSGSLPFSPTSRNPEIVKRVLIKRGEIPQFEGLSLAVLEPGQIDPNHSHKDSYEVIFVESGSGFIKGEKLEVQLKKGVCVVVEPKEIHGVVNNDESDNLILLCFGIKTA